MTGIPPTAANRVLGSRLRRSRPADFAELLGETAWQRLPLAVRRRFAHHAPARVLTYRGTMQVCASALGRYVAQLCRLLGTPVVPFVHEAVPVTVRVFDNGDHSGTIWERRYDFPGRSPVLVSSTKQLEADGTLVEALGAGLRMRLRVFEQDGALHFVSTRYYFQFGRLRLPIPHWLAPGVTRVTHEDRGAGWFRFTLHTEHPWFGVLYRQQGLFSARRWSDL